MYWDFTFHICICWGCTSLAKRHPSHRTMDIPETSSMKQSYRKHRERVWNSMNRHEAQVTRLVKKRDQLIDRLVLLGNVSQLDAVRDTALRWSFEETKKAKSAVLAYEDTRRKAARDVERRIRELNVEIGEMENVVQDLSLLWDTPADDVQSEALMQTSWESWEYWMDENVEYLSSGVEDSEEDSE